MTDYKEITTYIEDYFKKRIHDDGLDDIMNVEVDTSIETFDTVIMFSLYKFYRFKCILLYEQFENDRRDKFLSFIYEGSKEELLQFKKEDLQEI